MDPESSSQGLVTWVGWFFYIQFEHNHNVVLFLDPGKWELDFPVLSLPVTLFASD